MATPGARHGAATLLSTRRGRGCSGRVWHRPGWLRGQVCDRPRAAALCGLLAMANAGWDLAEIEGQLLADKYASKGGFLWPLTVLTITYLARGQSAILSCRAAKI